MQKLCMNRLFTLLTVFERPHHHTCWMIVSGARGCFPRKNLCVLSSLRQTWPRYAVVDVICRRDLVAKSLSMRSIKRKREEKESRKDKKKLSGTWLLKWSWRNRTCLPIPHHGISILTFGLNPFRVTK